MNNNLKATTSDGQSLHIEEEQTTPAAVVADSREIAIKRETMRFDQYKTQIEELKKSHGDLKIKGVDDKEGEKAVKKAWQGFRNVRLAIENKRKDVKADYLKIGQAIDMTASELTELLGSSEDDLKAELDRITDERQAIKDAEEKAKQQALSDRINELVQNGMAYNSGFYAIGETISMDVVTLKEMPEEVYRALLGRVQAENKKIVDALAEEKRIKDEADAAEKLRIENLELESKKLKASRINLRTKLVKALGLQLFTSDEGYSYNKEVGEHTVFIFSYQIEDLDDEEFDKVYADAEAEIESRSKLVLAIAARKALAAERCAQLVEMGFTEKDGNYVIVYQHGVGALLVQKEAIENYLQPEWINLLAEFSDSHKSHRLNEAAAGKRIADEEAEKKLLIARTQERTELLISKGFIRSSDGFSKAFKYPKLIKPIHILSTTVESSTPDAWEYVCSVHDDLVSRGTLAVIAEDKRIANEQEVDRVNSLSDLDRLREFRRKLDVLLHDRPDFAGKIFHQKAHMIMNRLTDVYISLGDLEQKSLTK